MANLFCDFEGGSDANNGTTFALRVKTITTGITAARVAPGDVVRIMGSPPSTSLAINATWTNKSPTVTLASALNTLITNCDVAWTASANVTCSADTGAYRTATASARANIAAGFTTGLVAYLSLAAAQNYSAFQGITLWLRVGGVALAASTLSIRLCSDTLGVTTVDTLALPEVPFPGQWMPVYINKGSALGSSIQSIALYADLDPATIDVFFDNISTVRAAGADALTLQSLIGKNTSNELWWGLRSISGTTLSIDHSPVHTPTAVARGYWGTTETVLTHKRETIKITPVQFDSQATHAVQEAGSAGLNVTYSGGWNRTDMSTQTLETWWDGQCGAGIGLATAHSYLTIDMMRFVRFSVGLTAAADQTWGDVGACHSGVTGFGMSGANDFTGTLIKSWANAVGWNLFGHRMKTTTYWGISNLSQFNTSGAGLFFNNDCRDVRIDTLLLHNNWDGNNGNNTIITRVSLGSVAAADNGRYGYLLDHIQILDHSIEVLTATGNTTAGLYLGNGVSSVIGRLVTSGNGLSIESTSASVLSGVHRVLASSLAEVTKVSLGAAGIQSAHGGIRFQNFNGVAGDHRFYIGGNLATIFSEPTVRNTASGLAWRISPLSATVLTVNFPLSMPLAKILCNTSALVTVKVFLRRTHVDLSGLLRCRGRQIAGVDATVSAAITAIADTWQEVTITFTPTEVGVVEIDIACYGGSTHSLFIDDLTVTQA